MTLHHIRFLLSIFLFTLVPQAAQALRCGDGVFANLTLTEDLNCDTGYVALEVFANDVTIDLNGHTVSGTSDLAGISIGGFKGVTVKNGALRGFWAGVNSNRSDDLIVDNITFYEVGHGVIISSGNGGRVVRNDFIRTTSSGVYITNTQAALSSNNNLVANNEFYQVQSGISVCGDKADYNKISGNLIWKSTDYAIQLNHADRNRLTGNRIIETVDNASIRLNNASYNLMSGNSIQGSAYHALTVLADAGGPCLATDLTRSLKNRFVDNLVVNMGQLILLGLGSTSTAEVVGTGTTDNRFLNNLGRITLERDAHQSYLRNNVFVDTDNTVDDSGTNNNY